LPAVELYDVWRYRHLNQADLITLKYVGFHTPAKKIPAGTVVRLSLSRYFMVNQTGGFWLQLSGAYLK
jgi:hypothetical protein